MKNKAEIIILAALLIMLLAAAAFALTYLFDNFDIKMLQPKPEPGVSAFDSVESLPPKSAQKIAAKTKTSFGVDDFAAYKV